jgi:hypothetical protein
MADKDSGSGRENLDCGQADERRRGKQMLKNRVSEEDLQGFSELRRGGIPLDEAVVEEIEIGSRGLVIRQSGNVAENCAFDLYSGGTAYMLAAAIYNASKQIHWAHEPRLELLWPESHFRWLENPWGKIPREYDYSFPPPGPAGFDPEVVLNHRLHHGCKLYPEPNDCLEGLLLGVGESPIPDHYVDRQGLKMRLSIYDEKGNRYASDVILRVSREQKRGRQQAKGSLRRGRELFAKHTQPAHGLES